MSAKEIPKPKVIPDNDKSTRVVKEDIIAARTDVYFQHTKKIVQNYGEKQVVYAFFIRRPVISSSGFMVKWLRDVADAQSIPITIEVAFPEGTWVGAGEPLVYVSGPFSRLAMLETMALQKLGATCVAAYNAYAMTTALPKVAFIAMEARHCAGFDMQEMVEYGAVVGSKAAQKEGAVGFIGGSVDATANLFGNKKGYGTIPHALIGYAGSTLRAVEMYKEMFPDEPITILPDYFGKEITDTLLVCKAFPDLVARGCISVRLDTHGGRFLEGLDIQRSYALLGKYSPWAIRHYRSEEELKHLVGMGVSAAAIWRLREALDEAGFDKVSIMASSGFDVSKCRTMAEAHAPIDMVGTGSFIPPVWKETHATADVIAYDGVPCVKKGREFLLKYFNKNEEYQG